MLLNKQGRSSGPRGRGVGSGCQEGQKVERKMSLWVSGLCIRDDPVQMRNSIMTDNGTAQSTRSAESAPSPPNPHLSLDRFLRDGAGKSSSQGTCISDIFWAAAPSGMQPSRHISWALHQPSRPWEQRPISPEMVAFSLGLSPWC